MFLSGDLKGFLGSDYHLGFQRCTQLAMRGPSPLTVGERELIAAYVSGLNACRHCHGAHKRVAVAFGVDGDLIGRLLHDAASAPVEARMRPVLAYVRKLTLTPSKMVQEDADAVLAAGWEEQALHDAIVVCALFNYFNRIVDGHGIEPHFALEAAEIAPDGPDSEAYGYLPDEGGYESSDMA